MVSLATKQIEFGTLYENVTGELKLPVKTRRRSSMSFAVALWNPSTKVEDPRAPKRHNSDQAPVGIILCLINLAVAVVVLVQIAMHQISSLRELVQMLAYALIYANLTGVLGVLAITGAVEKLALRKVRWPGGGGGCYRFLCRGLSARADAVMEIGSWCRRTSGKSTFAALRVLCRCRGLRPGCGGSRVAAGTRATGRGQPS